MAQKGMTGMAATATVQWGGGERLRELRGVSTQATMAERYRVTRVYWNRVENGWQRPGPMLVQLICIREGVSEEWLLNGRGPKRSRAAQGPGQERLTSHRRLSTRRSTLQKIGAFFGSLIPRHA